MIYAFWFHWELQSQLLFLLLMIFTLLYGCLVALLVFYVGNRGNPLVFTDKGVVLPFVAGSYWGEIESYSWEEYSGIRKVPGPTVLSFSEGTCLNIKPKGSILFSRWINGHGGSVMAIYLIFFSKEQIAQTEAIFCEYAVQKCANKSQERTE